MSWATYEPMQSSQQMAPPMDPGMMAGIGGMRSIGETQQLPSTMPNQLASRPPQPNPKKSVDIPKAKKESDEKWQDISEYENVYDWIYIVIAVLTVEMVVICLVRFCPDIFGKQVNIWYNRFKLSAVLADVLIILVGFGISRYVYSEWIYPKYDWSPVYFTLTTVVTQLVHDILFYIGVIRPMPAGQNAMIDVMKDYATSGGYKILGADSLMMIGSSVIAMLLKAAPAHIVASVGLLSAYVIPYVLETRNNFSNIA